MKHLTALISSEQIKLDILWFLLRIFIYLHLLGQDNQNVGFKRFIVAGHKMIFLSVGLITGLSEIFIGDRYSACKPGPKLIVHYTGLVQPPSKVWCEKVTGHSAMIVWSKGNKYVVDRMCHVQLNDDF